MRTTTVVIGAGHAGLAMSRCLDERSIDHVVLERGEVANSWKTERWDSLRLLTPNWQSRLPGYLYDGADPDDYRTMPETIDFLERYAGMISAPVRTHTAVTSVRRIDDGYEVVTSEGTWRCRTVVIATGACNLPSIPAVAGASGLGWSSGSSGSSRSSGSSESSGSSIGEAITAPQPRSPGGDRAALAATESFRAQPEAVPTSIRTLSPLEYRNPDQLEPGGVLVVGASASGTQIADELLRSGRPVTLSAGEHVRVPRLYRGRDIQWWMDQVGVLDERYTDVDSVERVRNVPSLQLTGSDERRTLDLNALTDQGVRLVGRLAGIAGGKAQFSGSLKNLCEMADLKMNRLLDRIDEWASERLDPGEVEPPHRFEPTRVEASPPLGMNLKDGSINTIVWATGFRPDYSWLDVRVFDRKGRIRHDGGVVVSPGMYLMGLPFLRRRKSSLIDGAGDDARDLSAHLAAYLAGRLVAPGMDQAMRVGGGL